MKLFVFKFTRRSKFIIDKYGEVQAFLITTLIYDLIIKLYKNGNKIKNSISKNKTIDKIIAILLNFFT